MISFNQPHVTGKELTYISDAVRRGHISGNGYYTKLCQDFFQNQYGFLKCLLTTSCTDALEMASLLLNIQPGDEVIMPAYTFVSTANAFALRGARIVFCDSRKDHPGMDEPAVESLITAKTRAIVVVHYAGVACDMDIIMGLAIKHNLFVVEDAAQAVDSFFMDKPLGSIGHLGCFSFHETKNISSGEGGMLTVNRPEYLKRAETMWEKGTNRAAFFRGEIDKYSWVDVGSSFLPSELISAYLWAQLEHLQEIQAKRLDLWHRYYKALSPICAELDIRLPAIPDFATNNAHMFYLVCDNANQRETLICILKEAGINAIFHYLALNNSPYYQNLDIKSDTPWARHYTDCLVRLPMYYDLPEETCFKVAKLIKANSKQLVAKQ